MSSARELKDKTKECDIKHIQDLINKYGLSDGESDVEIEAVTVKKSIYGVSHSVVFKKKDKDKSVEDKKEEVKSPVPEYKEEDRVYYQSGKGSCSL